MLRIRIRDPVPFWPLGPGSGMSKKIKIWDLGWTFRIIFPRAVTVLSTDTRRKENWICSKSINIIHCLLQCSASGSGSIGAVCFGPPGSGSISQRYGSGIPILLTSSKNSEKNLDSSCFLTFFMTFIFAALVFSHLDYFGGGRRPSLYPGSVAHSARPLGAALMPACGPG